MLLRVGNEGEGEVVDELLLVAQGGSLPVEEVPYGLETLRRRGQLLRDLPAAEVDVKAEVNLQVGGRGVNVRDDAGIVPDLEEGVLVGVVEHVQDFLNDLVGNDFFLGLPILPVHVSDIFDGQVQLRDLLDESVLSTFKLGSLKVLQRKESHSLVYEFYYLYVFFLIFLFWYCLIRSSHKYVAVISSKYLSLRLLFLFQFRLSFRHVLSQRHL